MVSEVFYYFYSTNKPDLTLLETKITTPAIATAVIVLTKLSKF